MVASAHAPTDPAPVDASARPPGPAGTEPLVERLCRQSVDKHFDAYADVDWDDPAMAVDPADGRFELFDFDPLAATDWYRTQPADVRARIGLERAAAVMRTGWEFENVLQRGLLTHAYHLRDGSARLRYLHHEVIEESQHTLMFQEFVGRAAAATGRPVRGLPRRYKLAAELLVVPLARVAPALFFFFVLGGEEPIDHVQRRRLRSGVAHPLLERIIRIHVTEEARHVSFARHYLHQHVPRLGRFERHALALAVPLLLGRMVRLMLAPHPSSWQAEGIPPGVARAAARSPQQRALSAASVSRLRALCTDLGLMGPLPRLAWRAAGLAGGAPR
jgi:hypothetical protein